MYQRYAYERLVPVNDTGFGFVESMNKRRKESDGKERCEEGRQKPEISLSDTSKQSQTFDIHLFIIFS